MINTDFLNPKFLKYFITVSDTGSFLTAGTVLNISQPSLTRAIQIIENNLKKKLFIRTKKGVQLTEEGEIFYLNAKSIISFNEKVVENLKASSFEKKEKLQDEIKIGIPTSLTFTHKENILWLINKHNKDKRIKIIEKNSFEINELVLSNQIDFAITCILPKSNIISSQLMYSDPYCVSFPKGHKFQNHKDVKLNEIRSEPNYVYRETCEFFYYNYMHENDDVPNQNKINQIISNRKKAGKNRDIIYTNSDATAASCIKAGLGVAVVSESLAVDHKLFYKHISNPKIERKFYYIQNINNKKDININIQTLKNAIWI